jgi:hypothetical protein
MRNRLLLTAAMAAAFAPTAGNSVELMRHAPGPSIGDWFRGKEGKRRAKKITRSVSSLQLRGWPETPCDAPAGYFWHQAPQGRRLYYLLKCAPGERHVEYDAKFDRSIIRSGWGYVKPTYAPGDVR